MQQQDDTNLDTDFDAYDAATRRRTRLAIVAVAVVIMVLGVLHATGVVGPG